MSVAVKRRGVGNEYPMRVIEFARRCAEFDYPVTQIQTALAKQGHRPSWSTVKCWVDEDYAEWARSKRRRGGPGRSAKAVWKRRLERMQDLRGAGLTFTGIANVMNLDFGLRLDSEQARNILRERLSLQGTRILLSGEKLGSGRIGVER